jgi:hypothetical protein
VSRRLPFVGNDGRGVSTPQSREPGIGDAPDFHPMTMPELRAWMRFLSARLRHVRILNGDWSRAVTSGATRTISVRQGGIVGLFLDPPYSAEAGRAELYSHEDTSVAHAVREWAAERGASPDTRIVLAGYEGEGHEQLEALGWRSVEWYQAGFLRGGMGNVGGSGQHQQHRERLWLSPHCLGAESTAQLDMFG